MTSIKAFATGVAFLGRRLAQALLVMLAVLVIAFAVRSSLGDSLREIVGEAVPEAEREQAIRSTLVHREGQPANVATAVLFLVENDFVTGVCLPVDGGRTIYAAGS